MRPVSWRGRALLFVDAARWVWNARGTVHKAVRSLQKGCCQGKQRAQRWSLETSGVGTAAHPSTDAEDEKATRQGATVVRPPLGEVEGTLVSAESAVRTLIGDGPARHAFVVSAPGDGDHLVKSAIFGGVNVKARVKISGAKTMCVRQPHPSPQRMRASRPPRFRHSARLRSRIYSVQLRPGICVHRHVRRCSSESETVSLSGRERPGA